MNLGSKERLVHRNDAREVVFDDYGALDSLYENDMLESVPVASGEQSNYEQALAARRTYKRKQSQRASAPSRGSAVVAVASWRRVR